MIQILHIEDDADHYQLARFALRDLPVASHERAVDLKDAVSTIRMQRFDVILIDLDLPDSGGVETVRRVAAEDPDAVLLVLSTNDPATMGEAAVLAGAEDFIPKSGLLTGQFVCAVRHALARRTRSRNAQPQHA